GWAAYERLELPLFRQSARGCDRRRGNAGPIERHRCQSRRGRIQFDATPSARPAFFRLNEDLLPTVRSRTQKIPKLKEFRRPVRIIFGAADPSPNSGVARTFHEFLPGSELFPPGCATLRPTG